MRKKILSATLASLFASASITFASPADREVINQMALLQSLAVGYFDGSITVGEWKTLGDTGIGTFNGLNGEMIMLDGVVYRANVNCDINIVRDRETIPFANTTFFDKDFSVKLSNVSDKTSLEKILDAQVKEHGENSFYMIKLSGDFNEVLVRSESASIKPYPTLVQALSTQQEKNFRNIKGTIVGLYCPKYMAGLNSTGWHFHFISSDKKIGGHVLQLNIKTGEAQFDKTDNFAMKLPEKDNFHEKDYSQDLREDIRKAENDTVK